MGVLVRRERTFCRKFKFSILSQLSNRTASSTTSTSSSRTTRKVIELLQLEE